MKSLTINQQPRQQGFFTTLGNFAYEKPYTCLKAGGVAIKVLWEMNLLKEGELGEVHDALVLAKSAKGPWDLIDKSNKFMGSVQQVVKDPSMGNTATLFRRANECISPVKKTMKFFLQFSITDFSKETIRTVKGIGGISLALAKGWDAFDSLYAISKISFAKAGAISTMNRHMISLAKNISHVALGILAVLAVYFGCKVASSITVALSVSTVVFTIMAYFYKNLWKELPNLSSKISILG